MVWPVGNFGGPQVGAEALADSLLTRLVVISAVLCHGLLPAV